MSIYKNIRKDVVLTYLSAIDIKRRLSVNVTNLHLSIITANYHLRYGLVLNVI